MRAYTGMMLLGNIGGFLGLLLGYALIQIPSDLVHMFFKFKQYYTEKRGDKKDQMVRIKKMIAPNDLNAGNTKSIFFKSAKFTHENDALHCFSIKNNELAQKNTDSSKKPVDKFLDII